MTGSTLVAHLAGTYAAGQACEWPVVITKSRPNECLGDSVVNVRRGGHVHPTGESPKGVFHEKERRHSSGSGGG
jgi:hypothetical protein